MVPNLSPYKRRRARDNKDFMLSHGYIKTDFDVHQWAAPKLLEHAASELLEEEWKSAGWRSFPRRSRSRRQCTSGLGSEPIVNPDN
jgi:hypothetical protein